MNKRLLLVITVLLFGLLLPVFKVGRALAQTKTATATASPVDEETVKETLKKRLEGTLDEKLDKVKGVLEESKKLYGFIGEVGKLGQDSFEQKRAEKTRQVNYDSKTALVFSGKDGKSKTIKAEEITSGWFALAMGMADEKGNLAAQRIVFYAESPIGESKFRVIFGKVAEIDSQKLVLKNHEEASLVMGKKVQLKISGVSEPQLTDITVDDKAVAVLRQEAAAEELTLKALFVWPGATSPEAQNNQVNATASAQPKATE